MNRHALSKVKTFNLIDSGSATYVQFGDHSVINAKSKIIAVMQSKTSTNAGEPMFDQYAIFNPKFKQHLLPPLRPVQVSVHKPIYLCELPNMVAEKMIDHIDITIVSNSASILIGNGKRHYGEHRQKNIRQHL